MTLDPTPVSEAYEAPGLTEADEVPFDLYEFPKDYVGRKRYVSVLGHSRSIPYLYTYLGSDRRNHVLPEYGGEEPVGASGPMIMGDIKGYQSTLEKGVYISSRSQHRDHMRKHGVIEVGNEALRHHKPTNNAPMTRAGQDIVRALQGNR